VLKYYGPDYKSIDKPQSATLTMLECMHTYLRI
jgi:hypothetical protein